MTFRMEREGSYQTAPELLMIPGTSPIPATTVTGLIAVIRQFLGEHIRHRPKTVTELTELGVPGVTQTESNYQMEQIHYQEHYQDQKDPKNPVHLFPPQFPASA